MPPRWDAQTFKANAQAIETKHADLYQILEPLRSFSPSDQGQIDELKALVEAANVERQSTKDTTDQLEKATKNAAAFVLNDIAVSDLDVAIAAHSRAATMWLIIALVIALIAFRLAWWVNIPDDKILWGWGPVFPQIAKPFEWTEIVVSLAKKVLLLAAAFGVPLLAVHVYYTNLHNLIVNRQRKISINAFTKFYALMQGADEATKVELVKQAAQTIFAQGTTGFLAKGRPDLPLMQLANTLAKTGKL